VLARLSDSHLVCTHLLDLSLSIYLSILPNDEVRNAFGNYFDILKEVTYSPMMAEMLTYVGGVSTGRAWTVQNKLHHADEVRFKNATNFPPSS
jgi:hypothetical protein